MGATGKECAKHRHELETIVRKIMLEHSQRKGCGWKPGAVDIILDDIAELIERQEICKVAA